jgi:hypothetical protein
MTSWLRNRELSVITPGTQVLAWRGAAAAPGLAKRACCAYLALAAVTAVLGGICLALPTAESPLYKAVQAGAPADEVVALLREGADLEDGLRAAVPLVGGLLRAASPLFVAAEQGNTAAVEALREAGARPEAGATLGLGPIVADNPTSTSDNPVSEATIDHFVWKIPI